LDQQDINNTLKKFNSFEEAYYYSIESVLTNGQEKLPNDDKFSPGKKRKTKELKGAGFILENPRDRIIFNNIRQFNIFTAIGHFMWFFAGSTDLSFINYYNKRANAYSDDQKTHRSAYGMRLMNYYNGLSQIESCIDRLTMDKSSRRAYATIYAHEDSFTFEAREIPCTLGLHFLITDNKLDCMCTMRSQSATFVMPYDIFIHTLLQEYVAKRLNVELGSYYHYCNSLHIYENEYEVSKKILENKVNSIPMLEIDSDNVKAIFEFMLEWERDIRTNAINKKTTYITHLNNNKFLHDMLTILQLYSINKIDGSISQELIKTLDTSLQKSLEIIL